MSQIDELIAEYCPAGVDHKTLGDVGEFIRGNGLQKKDLFDEGFPAVHYGQIHTLYGISTSETFSFTTPEIASKLRHARHGDLLIATTSEDDEAVAKATAWLGGTEVVLSGDAYIYRHELEPRYVSYFFQSRQFQDQKQRHISGTKVRRISGSSLAKLVIPVPPLEIQRHIADILDTFSKLEAELEAELEARKQQYEHYRHSAFETSESVPHVPLGNLTRIKTGSAVSKRAIEDNPGQYPVINSGREPLGFIGTFNTENDPIGVTSRGAGVGSITWCNEPYFRGNLNYAVTIRDPKTMVVRYLFHALNHLQPEIQGLCTFQGIPALNKSNLEKLLIPVPSIDEQQRIVGFLDQLDSFVNDLSIGLPAELVARRQQYKYYRDKLLTFKELEPSS